MDTDILVLVLLVVFVLAIALLGRVIHVMCHATLEYVFPAKFVDHVRLATFADFHAIHVCLEKHVNRMVIPLNRLDIG